MATYPGTRIGTPKGRVPFSGAPYAQSAFNPASYEGEILLMRPLSYAIRHVDPVVELDESDTEAVITPTDNTESKAVRYTAHGSPRPQRVVLADICVLTGEDADTVYCDTPVSQPWLLDALESVIHDETTDLVAGTLRKERGAWRLTALTPPEAHKAWHRALDMEWGQGFGPESAAARLAGNIRREREERGIRQADLGAPLGLDQTQISRIEGGRRDVGAIEAREFAKVLGVDLTSLLP